MYNIQTSHNLIRINFDTLVDLATILIILHYYFNNKNCIILKTLLIVNRSGIKWYNDISAYKNKPLIYLLIKFKDEFKVNNHISSHISDTELNSDLSIEIHTVNPHNTLPVLISRQELTNIIYKEIDMNLS